MQTMPKEVETNSNEYSFCIENVSDTLNYLVLAKNDTLNKWKLPYEIFRLEIGDIDGDSIVDAMVGVIKTTRFDKKLGKRLFLFKNYKGLIRPLWLGSRLSQPLVDFVFKGGRDPRIRTVEKEKSKKYLVAEYKWRKFGLEFVRYVDREIDIQTAMHKLDTDI